MEKKSKRRREREDGAQKQGALGEYRWLSAGAGWEKVGPPVDAGATGGGDGPVPFSSWVLGVGGVNTNKCALADQRYLPTYFTYLPTYLGTYLPTCGCCPVPAHLWVSRTPGEAQNVAFFEFCTFEHL